MLDHQESPSSSFILFSNLLNWVLSPSLHGERLSFDQLSLQIQHHFPSSFFQHFRVQGLTWSLVPLNCGVAHLLCQHLLLLTNLSVLGLPRLVLSCAPLSYVLPDRLIHPGHPTPFVASRFRTPAATTNIYHSGAPHCKAKANILMAFLNLPAQPLLSLGITVYPVALD